MIAEPLEQLSKLLLTQNPSVPQLIGTLSLWLTML